MNLITHGGRRKLTQGTLSLNSFNPQEPLHFTDKLKEAVRVERTYPRQRIVSDSAGPNLALTLKPVSADFRIICKIRHLRCLSPFSQDKGSFGISSFSSEAILNSSLCPLTVHSAFPYLPQSLLQMQSFTQSNAPSSLTEKQCAVDWHFRKHFQIHYFICPS